MIEIRILRFRKKMVEEIKHAANDDHEHEHLIELPADLDLEDNVEIFKQPKYLSSIEKEIERLFENAKIDMTELGLDIDRENEESK